MEKIKVNFYSYVDKETHIEEVEAPSLGVAINIIRCKYEYRILVTGVSYVDETAMIVSCCQMDPMKE